MEELLDASHVPLMTAKMRQTAFLVLLWTLVIAAPNVSELTVYQVPFTPFHGLLRFLIECPSIST